MKCKDCKHLIKGEELKCAILKTHCRPHKNFDLGEKLPGCKFEAKEKKHEVQS